MALTRATVSVIEGLEPRTLFAVIPVTNGSDEDSGGNPIAGSLRAAIVAANLAPGSTISFSTLPAGTVIKLSASLETTPITAANTIIDGTTSPGKQVTVDGSGFDGLSVTGNSVTIQGLWLENMGTALLLSGGQDDIVQDNYIGDVTNSGTDKNTIGIDVTGNSTDDTIGGSEASQRNVISGNSNVAGTGAGIIIEAPTESYTAYTNGILVEGNYIGVDPTGAVAAPNDYGVIIDEAEFNTIQGNVISGNTDDGVLTENIAYAYYMYSNTITSNIIGMDSSAQNPIPNGEGIDLNAGPSGVGDVVTLNTIEYNTGIGVETDGVQGTISNNTIANNGGTGVVIDGANSSTSAPAGELNTISQNSIYLNGKKGPASNLGIDLGNDGVTQNTNTSGTTITGANGLTPFPVIGTIATDPNDSTMLAVPLTLQANPSTQYTIEVFASESAIASPSGYGQGQFYIGDTTITTGQNGAGTGSYDISNQLYAGLSISATATNSGTFNATTNVDAGATSEFSEDVTAPGTALPTVTIIGGSAEVGKSITFPIVLSAPTSVATSFTYTITPGTAPLTDINTTATGTTGTLTIPAGTTQKDIVIPVVGDSTGGNEQFTITLSMLSADAQFSNLQSTESAVGTILATASGTTATTTTLTAAPTTGSAGSAIVLTATVTGAGGPPTGTVTFFDGTVEIGTSTLGTGGVATLTTTTLPVGSDSITAVYNGNDTFAGSTSNAVTVTITGAVQKGSTIVLTANPTSGGLGTSVVLTATVTGTGAVPTGTVQFTDNGTVIGTATLNNAGKAVFTTTTLPLGSDSIVAKYLGNGTFATSTSNTVVVTITATGTATTVTMLTAAPVTAGVGSAVNLTATVSAGIPGGATPAGTLTFLLNGVSIGTGTLNASGIATLTTTALPVGTDGITASYPGDSSYAGSTSTPVTVTINAPLTATTTVLTASSSTVAFGNPVTLTATVSHATGSNVPTGTVTFVLAGTILGTATLTTGGTATLTLSTLPAGYNSIVGDYGGDSNYLYSASAPKVVLVTSTANTSLAISTNPVIVFNDAVTFTASVASATAGGATPTGIVSFYQRGNVLLGTGQLSSDGVASITTTALELGSDPVTAVYGGEPVYPSSTSPSVTLTVLSAPNVGATVTTTVTTTTVVGDVVTVTSTVTPKTTGGATPTGTVSFFTNGILIGTANVQSNGTAVLTTTALVVGSNTVTSVYNGNAIYSTSAPASTSAFLNTLGLVPVIVKSTIPATGLVAGTLTHGVVTLNITNVTAALIREPQTTIHLYASTDGTIDSSSVLIQQWFTSIKLKGGKTQTFRLNVKSLPVGMASGTYQLMIRVSNTVGTFGYYFTGPTLQVAAAHISLTGSLTATQLPSTIVSGDDNGGFAQLTLTDNGNFTASGAITIDLTLSSTNGVLGTPIRTDVIKTVISPGNSRTFMIPLGTLPTLTAGNYYLVAQVTDPLGVTSIVSSPVTIAIASSFGT
jgi:hypothetical protein